MGGPISLKGEVGPFSFGTLKMRREMNKSDAQAWAQELAKQIGIPTAEWPGRCHEIAGAAMDVGFVKGFLCYGMYCGEIAKGSYFQNRITLGFCRHGWVEMEDGSIFDPTRWVFEAEEPYIYESPFQGDYDYGMARFRTMIQDLIPIPCPKLADDDRWHPLPENRNLAAFISAVCGVSQDSTKISVPQLFWLCNRMPKQLGSNITDIYKWIVEIGHEAFIPIDFAKKYLERPAEFEARRQAS